jgi:hypothetical protein
VDLTILSHSGDDAFITRKTLTNNEKNINFNFKLQLEVFDK